MRVAQSIPLKEPTNMAAPFITLNKTDANATHAARILSAKVQVQSLINSLEDLVAESFQMFDGSGDQQFVLPATKYGCSGATATADAQTIFNDMNGILLALKGQAQNANAVDFSTRIG